MPEKSPEISREEEKPLELTEEDESRAKSIEALKRMKELVGEKGDKELEELEKKLLAESIGEINQMLGETRLEASDGGKLNIDPKEIAQDVGLENFKVIKKDKLINPETGEKTNINRIEFDLELKYPNKEKEILRFISLEIPEEYKDLTKCHAYKELIEDIQSKSRAPKLEERFDQKFITWQKYMMRRKNNPQKIRTNIPWEEAGSPSDIKREVLRRGMRMTTIEENIVFIEILKRNGFSEWGKQNKERVEEFLGIKDLWAAQEDGPLTIEFGFYTSRVGRKCPFVRGVHWMEESVRVFLRLVSVAALRLAIAVLASAAPVSFYRLRIRTLSVPRFNLLLVFPVRIYYNYGSN